MSVTIGQIVAIDCGAAAHIGQGTSIEIGSVYAERCGAGVIAEGERPMSITQYLTQHIADSSKRDELEEVAQLIMLSESKVTAQSNYDRFVTLSANYVTILGPILTVFQTYIQQLSN